MSDKAYRQPHLTIFQNEDGTWGENGELDSYVRYLRDPKKGYEVGSSSCSPTQRQWETEARFYKEKFDRCLNVMEEMRRMQRVAADKLDTGIADAYKGLAPTMDAFHPVPARPTDHNVADKPNDGQLPVAGSLGKRTSSRKGTAGPPPDSNKRSFRES